MKHLQKITIRNARRFKDVEIEFGPGANIILATNGTGKTTLFEAIEFALTGSIQRLENPPLSLIRDKQDGMDVRLDFGSNKFCEVNYRKGNEPVLRGDHHLIYPKHELPEIPYLLRLTHLLEQRGSNWFIQKDKSDAGTILDKLSLAKDLNDIIKTKTNALSAATKHFNRAIEELQKTNDKVNYFEEKLNERVAVAFDYELRPLNELLEEISSIYKSINNNQAQKTEIKLDSILALIGQVQTYLTYSIESNSQFQMKLFKIENKINVFKKNAAEIQAKEQLNNEEKKIIAIAEIEIAKAKNENLEKREQINLNTRKFEVLSELKKLFAKRELELANSLATNNDLSDLSKLLPIKNENLQRVTNTLDVANKIRSKHKLLQTHEAELHTKQGELLSFDSLIIEWQRLQDIIIQFETIKIHKLTQEKNNYEQSLENFRQKLAVTEKEFSESQAKLFSLRSVSDAIQSAVGIISANLPDTQEDCPVCNTKFQPSELRIRINLALLEIDPVLKEEIIINKAIQERVELEKNELELKTSALNVKENEIKEAKENVSNSKMIINERFIPKFSNCKTFEEANKWLSHEKMKVGDELIKIANEKIDLNEYPTGEQVQELVLEKEQLAKEIEAIESNMRILSLKLNTINEDMESIKLKIGNSNIDKVNQDISQLENLLTQETKDQHEGIRNLENLENQLENANKNLLSQNGLIFQLTGQQNEILAEWREAGLTSEPFLDTYSKRLEFLLNEDKELKNKKEELNKIDGELSRWKTAERYFNLNNEIKIICGDTNEMEYLKKLREESIKSEIKLNLITEKKEALNMLYNKIGEEVDIVHNQIVAINPMWVSLLKKVVINPRFVNTILSSYAFRNKPHADVKVNLHDTTVQVMEVASEAQATDLQLTFILSMASSYNWTPWKALLLDDPTQHHDLVHAAGVFDLLRDFIVDQDFQIILGTHDSIQARFFQRKLQNDGVPVKLWNLIADSNGVIAESL